MPAARSEALRFAIRLSQLVVDVVKNERGQYVFLQVKVRVERWNSGGCRLKKVVEDSRVSRLPHSLRDWREGCGGYVSVPSLEPLSTSGPFRDRMRYALF